MGLRDVHDFHRCRITQSLRALSAHILTDDVSISKGSVIQREINELVSHKYNISHATLQLGCVGCESDLLYCDISDGHRHEHDEHLHQIDSP
jgi:cobalt-zinc-cadmium efflux system protein